MKIVYFGTPPYAADVLSELLAKGVEVLAVVTKPDKPRGRSGKPHYSAVKQYVRECHPKIPVFTPDKASAPPFVEELRLLGADLFVVVAYGEIVKETVLALPRHGCINLHTSLLPTYRGAAPIQFALLDGAKESGVTVIEMVRKMDAGDIIAQEKIAIPPEMNFEELEKGLTSLGAKTLMHVIEQFEQGTVKKIPQNHDEATYVQKIDPSQAQIDWNKPAETLHNLVRAFSPKPGAWCLVEVGGAVRRLKIYRAELTLGEGTPGETLSYGPSGWQVACGTCSLTLHEVQLEGKKRLTLEEFSRGISKPPKLKL